MVDNNVKYADCAAYAVTLSYLHSSANLMASLMIFM